MSAGDVDTRFFAAEGEAGCFGLQSLTRSDRFGQRFASATTAFFGPCFIDFVGALGRIGQNQYLVTGDLQEATADGHGLLGAALFDADHAWK
jgi:hypothetical protein